MKHALPVAVLTLLLAAPAFADDLCFAGADKGMTVTVRGRSPLGPGTNVTVSADGVTIRMAPDKVVFLARSTDNVWVAFTGNYIKGTMNQSGSEAGGSYGFIELKKEGNQLVIRRKADPRKRGSDPQPDPGLVMRVSTVVREGRQAAPREIGTTVLFETPGGADVGTFRTHLTWAQHQAGVDLWNALSKRAKEDFNNNELKHKRARASAGTVDLTDGHTNKLRTGCGDQATELTGQGAGGVTPPGPAAPGG